MQGKLEIHTNENPINHSVKITKLIGPRRPDLPAEGGFYVRPASGRLVLVRPEQEPLLVLREGMYLSPSKFRERHEFIVETRAELNSQRMKTVKIEVDKPREKITRPRMFDIDSYFISNIVKATTPCEKKKKERNTGIQVAVIPYESSSLFKVTHIQALSHEELPSKYLTSNLPKIWQGGNKLFAEPDLVLLAVNCVYRSYYIQGVLQHIRLAGEHLAMVNKREDSSWTNYKSATFKDGKLT